MPTIIDDEKKEEVADFTKEQIIILKRNKAAYTVNKRFFNLNNKLIEDLQQNSETKKFAELLQKILGKKESVIITYVGPTIRTDNELLRRWGCGIVIFCILVYLWCFFWSGDWIPA